MVRLIKIFSVILLFLFIIIFIFVKTEEKIVYPSKAKDSDGSLENEIIENNIKGYESVSLKFYPFGYIEFWGWNKTKYIKKVYAYIMWKAEKDFGAGNIFIGYSFDGKNYIEIGPFEGSNEYKLDIIEIPTNFLTNIENLRIRFRGEDIDYALDAFAEVKVWLKVISYRFGL
ncbi:MAG: hypothetical protein QXX45_02125 [Candidatus Aenigmatarchaeota archaeon]